FDSIQGFDDSVSGTVNVFETSLGLLADQDGNTAFRLFTLTFDTLANGLSPLSFTDNIASTGEFLGDENGDPFVPPVSAGRGSVCVGGNCQQSQPIPVPEPPVVMLMGAGLLGFAFNQRHRRAGVR
ncbi:PEP-CTERM sorting domain-containing protein, partial [Methylocaldum sp.]|uniref:PEP-CTERM sorting domain-containing protein n=1 Tax=Methylocaldum sp. TaxID=1969727 RepID=UPI0032203292